MHVTVAGAGALGRVYGARLASSGVAVAFLVRPSRVAEDSAIVIEQVNGSHERNVLDAPHRVAAVPSQSDVVLVTVRFDQLHELGETLRAAPKSASIVVLTPLLPDQQRELDALVGRPVVPAMPGVAGYMTDAELVRYWVLTATSTLLEDGETAEQRNQRGELARHLHRAGLPTRVEKGVASMNAATTISFFPLILAIDTGAGIDGVLGDKRLLETALDAAKESDKLAHAVGRVVPAAGVLTKFVGPFTLKAGIALARKLSPEAVTFVERHFGPKLHAQHLAMGEAILALGRERGVSMPALAELVQKNRERGGPREPAR